MKKIWKVLGVAALVASLIPYKAEQDLETGEKTYDALLWQLKSRPDHKNGGTQKEITIFPGRRPRKAAQEAAMFDDDFCDRDFIDVEAAPVEEPGSNEETHFDPNF